MHVVDSIRELAVGAVQSLSAWYDVETGPGGSPGCGPWGLLRAAARIPGDGALEHAHDRLLVGLSIVIAVFASYTALDLVNAITVARGRARHVWLLGGSIAMGIGIWSMHFVGMLAFSVPGFPIAYDVWLLILSVLVAIAASALALHIVSRERVTVMGYVGGSLAMGAAISGMHYIGIASMRMAAEWTWDYRLVAASVLIAVTASFVAILLAFHLRDDMSRRGFWYRGAGGVVMGLAIAGMHYTAMAAMAFYPAAGLPIQEEQLLATSGLAVAVIGTTLLLLAIALAGSVVDRALARQQATILARDEFISIASHELKTPITALKLQAQVRRRQLAKGDPGLFTPDRLAGMFEQDARQIERLAQLVEDMLDISRISAGRLELRLERFDLEQAVREVLERHRAQLESVGSTVTLESQGPVDGEWDRFRLEQVLANLLTNAMKYGAGKPVKVVLAKADKLARLSVTDGGIGIDPANHERIFERFERAISSKHISGLGLGLYISRQIVKLHGGRVWVESALGKGATFHVELPLEPPRAQA